MHTAVSLPFPVSFYGNTYSTGWVSTNGVVSFADPGDADLAVPGSIPDTAAPDALVAPFWADLDLDAQSSVRTQTVGTAPSRQFVVEWRDASFFTEPTDHSRRITFEAVFTEGGGVRFNYSGLDDDVERGASAAVGIESPGGVYGLQYSFQSPALTTGTAVVYTYPVDAHPILLWSVSGTVTRGGIAAAGVPVTVLPRGVTATTDASGHYQFANLEPDGYTIAASDGCRAASGAGGEQYRAVTQPCPSPQRRGELARGQYRWVEPTRQLTQLVDALGHRDAAFTQCLRHTRLAPPGQLLGGLDAHRRGHEALLRAVVNVAFRRPRDQRGPVEQCADPGRRDRQSPGQRVGGDRQHLVDGRRLGEVVGQCGERFVRAGSVAIHQPPGGPAQPITNGRKHDSHQPGGHDRRQPG